MTPYEFAATLTENEMANVIGYWEQSSPAKLKTFRSLIRLGDPQPLAVATVMMKTEQKHSIYQAAYAD